MTTVQSIDVRRATNLHGPLSADIKRRLEAVLTEPSSATWNDAYSIILNAETMTTLWQAVLQVNRAFPCIGPREGDEWSVVPSRAVLLAAIHQAVQD